MMFLEQIALKSKDSKSSKALRSNNKTTNPLEESSFSNLGMDGNYLLILLAKNLIRKELKEFLKNAINDNQTLLIMKNIDLFIYMDEANSKIFNKIQQVLDL